MSKRQRKFADDGWAVWVDGDDTSTVYINDWINPKGKSYVDIAVRIRGVKSVKSLNVYVPFSVAEKAVRTGKNLPARDGYLLSYCLTSTLFLSKSIKIWNA